MHVNYHKFLIVKQLIQNSKFHYHEVIIKYSQKLKKI